jgi:hypothetical protein
VLSLYEAQCVTRRFCVSRETLLATLAFIVADQWRLPTKRASGPLYFQNCFRRMTAPASVTRRGNRNCVERPEESWQSDQKFRVRFRSGLLEANHMVAGVAAQTLERLRACRGAVV